MVGAFIFPRIAAGSSTGKNEEQRLQWTESWNENKSKLAIGYYDGTIEVFGVSTDDGKPLPIIGTCKTGASRVLKIEWLPAEYGNHVAVSTPGKLSFWLENTKNFKSCWILGGEIKLRSEEVCALSFFVTHPGKLLLVAVQNDGWLTTLACCDTLHLSTWIVESETPMTPRAVDRSQQSVFSSASICKKPNSFLNLPPSFVVGVCDVENLESGLQIWTYLEKQMKWRREVKFRDSNMEACCIRTISWAPGQTTSEWIATGSEEGVHIWNLDFVTMGNPSELTKPVAFFSSHGTKVHCVEWDPTCSSLASVLEDGTVHLWKSTSNGGFVLHATRKAMSVEKEGDDTW